MKTQSTFARVLRGAAVAASLIGLAVITQPAGPAAAAYCPAEGQRVKSPNDPKVYLVGPEGNLNWIPSLEVYNSLWDSWYVTDVSQGVLDRCFGANDYYTMYGAELVMTSNGAVHIYYAPSGGYRWVSSLESFTKYGFSWSRVKTVSAYGPVVSPVWD